MKGARPTGPDDVRTRRRSSYLTKRPSSQRSRWRPLAVLILVIGLAVSGVSASAWYSYVSSLRRQTVLSSLGNVKSILGTSLERDSDLLATVNAEVATHPQMTNASLEMLLTRLDLAAELPGKPRVLLRREREQGSTPELRSRSQAGPALGRHRCEHWHSGRLVPWPSRLLPDASGCGRRPPRPDDAPERALVLGRSLFVGEVQLLCLSVRGSARRLGQDREIFVGVGHEAGGAAPGHGIDQRNAAPDGLETVARHGDKPGLRQARTSLRQEPPRPAVRLDDGDLRRQPDPGPRPLQSEEHLSRVGLHPTDWSATRGGACRPTPAGGDPHGGDIPRQSRMGHQSSREPAGERPVAGGAGPHGVVRRPVAHHLAGHLVEPARGLTPLGLGAG